MSLLSSSNVNHLSVNNLVVTGAADVVGPVSVTGPIAVSGAASIGGALSVTGATTLSGTTQLNGATTAAALLTASAGLSVGAPLTVSAATASTGSSTVILNNYAAGTVTLTLPTPASSIGRVLIVANLEPQSVSSSATNILPLGSVIATSTILPATDAKFAILVSNGTNYVTVASN